MPRPCPGESNFNLSVPMKMTLRSVAPAFGCIILIQASSVVAQDWPQWRGVNRDAKVSGFNPPKTWPKELAQKWKVPVGQGPATPALVGDKLYVFARQEGNEITRCLNAATGKEIWQDKYEAQGATGPAAPHSGPRSSPTVAGGKVITYGVRGTLSCLDAATGSVVWRKEDFKGAWPTFFTSSSPIITGPLCIAQLGGGANGGIVAYEVATGKEIWKWTEDGTAYASPVLLAMSGVLQVVALTEKSLVGLNAADGKLKWQVSFAPAQRMQYNAATAIVDGQTVIVSGTGRGTKAVKIEKEGDTFTAKELWSNPDNAVQFNTPVTKNGLVFGLTSRDAFFCLNSKDGQSAWSAPSGGKRGFGSIVDAGPVLLALTPSAQLIVFEPSDKEFKQIASYKVAESETYAHPVAAGNRVFIKDQENVALWTIE
jgi:outer membrane protein assembly factor BamB